MGLLDRPLLVTHIRLCGDHIGINLLCEINPLDPVMISVLHPPRTKSLKSLMGKLSVKQWMKTRVCEQTI